MWGIKELVPENKDLRQVNNILKAASAFFAQAQLERHLKN
jgi:transposase